MVASCGSVSRIHGQNTGESFAGATARGTEIGDHNSPTPRGSIQLYIKGYREGYMVSDTGYT